MTPGRGRMRARRGLVVSLACVALPTGAHVLAGGGLPGDAPFLFAAVLLAVACVALADRQRSAAEITAVVFATQPVMHVLLALSSHGAGMIVPTPAMVVAHLLAATAVAALLTGGETLVWSFAALADTVLLRAARRLLSWIPTGEVSVAGRIELGAAHRHAWRAVRSTPHRGPPVVTCP